MLASIALLTVLVGDAAGDRFAQHAPTRNKSSWRIAHNGSSAYTDDENDPQPSQKMESSLAVQNKTPKRRAITSRLSSQIAACIFRANSIRLWCVFAPTFSRFEALLVSISPFRVGKCEFEISELIIIDDTRKTRNARSPNAKSQRAQTSDNDV